MQRQKKQLKTVVVVESNVTNALIAEDSLLSRQLSGATHLKSDNYASKCILMAWAYEVLKELQKFTT